MKFIYIYFVSALFLEAQTITIQGGSYTIPSFKTFYANSSLETVTIKTFKIDKYEVSNKLFGKKTLYEEDINLPIVKIRYKEALQFCQNKGGNLPSVEQWIIASSFEDNHFFKFATKEYPIMNEDNINVIQERAIELETEGWGSFPDLVDVEDALVGNNNIVGMLGNVWELTRSDSKYTILKGGSFYNSEAIDLMNNLVENRVLKSSLKEYEHIGFRCVYEK